MNDLEMLIQMLDTVEIYGREGRKIKLELYPDRSGAFYDTDKGKIIFTWGKGFLHLFENYSLWVAREMRQR